MEIGNFNIHFFNFLVMTNLLGGSRILELTNLRHQLAPGNLKYYSCDPFTSRVENSFPYVQNRTFSSKVNIRVWLKIDSSKIGTLVEQKNRHCMIGQKLKFWFKKIEISVKKWNFGQKLKFWFKKIEISVKNWNFGLKKSKFRLKIELSLKIQIS